MKLFELEGVPVLVTGGYGHLGAAMTAGLAEHGAHVYVLGRSEERFAAAFSVASDAIRYVYCDVGEGATIREAFRRVRGYEGRIGALVNNASYVEGQGPLDLSDDQWARSMDGVASSAYRCIREIVPYFRESGGGSIINIASMYGLVSPDFSVYDESPAYFNPPHYGAAKAAVIQMTRYFAWYLGSEGIRVNAIAPGPFPNPRVQTDQGFVDHLSRRTALKRIGRPEEIVGAVVFLASAASSYVTGHTLVVDGGWTAS
jgi:NAD(P)-dependent dehydrogenase (short-subunit alcohol dehydrogenase family)